MSGITPLLDTLLHQVLGKRVDTPPPRDLNQPVRPTSPAEAPRALHSDSRLDARTGPRPLSTPPTSTDRPAASAPPLQQAGQASRSAQTHFSHAGRTIADLLVRFPAPPSSVAPPAPLILPGQPLDAATLAARLEGSFRDSGLFYESHLARWYRGELSRQQLEREPQMWRTQRFTPPSPTPGEALSRLAPRQAPTAPAAAAPTTPHETPPTPRGPAAEAASRIPLAPDPVQDSLQGLVRHQLELLVTPTLRWEGDVWSGLFMALMLQPPRDAQVPSREAPDRSSQEDDRQRGWRSQIDLEVTGLGRVQASLWMHDTQLEIALRTGDEVTRQSLEAGLERLRARLDQHDFDRIALTLTCEPFPTAGATP